jgi:hypothetical protein
MLCPQPSIVKGITSRCWRRILVGNHWIVESLLRILSGDLHWTICGSLVKFTCDMCGRKGWWWCEYLHPDFAVITCGGEHGWIRGIPGYGVAAAFFVAVELLD